MDELKRTIRDMHFRGYFRAAGMLIGLLFRLPGWAIKGAISRRHFRQELYAAGVPKKAAMRLSNRYKIGGWRNWQMAHS